MAIQQKAGSGYGYIPQNSLTPTISPGLPTQGPNATPPIAQNQLIEGTLKDTSGTGLTIDQGFQLTGGLVDAAGTIFQAGLQSSDIAKRRDEAIELAGIRRGDELAGLTISNQLRNEGFKQDEKAFKLQQLNDSYVQRYNSFIKGVKKSQAQLSQQQKLAQKVSSVAKNNDTLSDIMIQNWGA